MPRPHRIEYENENAFYPVMERGRERHTIFHRDELKWRDIHRPSYVLSAFSIPIA
jgi:hypothetical protein